MFLHKKLHNILIFLILFYFFAFGKHSIKADDIFRSDDHCLAYQTKETILLFIDSIVIGKTCEISLKLERENKDTRIIVSFPIRSLDSGIDMRDEDVIEMLSVESNTEIRFVSNFLTVEQVSDALAHGKTKLKGNLEFAGKSFNVLFPLKLTPEYGTWLVTGKLITSLSAFGLKLPSVLGGVIADTQDYLELLVHIRFDAAKQLEELQSNSI